MMTVCKIQKIKIIQNDCRNVDLVAKSSELAVCKLLKKNLKTLMAAQNVIFKSQDQNVSFTLIMSLILFQYQQASTNS